MKTAWLMLSQAVQSEPAHTRAYRTAVGLVACNLGDAQQHRAALQPLYVKRVEPFRRFFHIKLNLFFVLERPTGLFISNVGVMYEYIFGTVMRGDEAKPLLDAEPFHCSLWHIGVGLGDCATPPSACVG